MRKYDTARFPMVLSLQRLRARRAHAPWTARALAAWLALSIVFALAPCCELSAAVMPGNAHAATPDPAVVSHDDTGGGEKPCAAWLDRTDALPVETGVLPTVAPKFTIAVPSVFHLPPSPVAAVRQPFVASASPPDALYLRYLRLIL